MIFGAPVRRFRRDDGVFLVAKNSRYPSNISSKCTNCELIYCGKCRLTTGDVYGRMVSEEK